MENEPRPHVPFVEYDALKSPGLVQLHPDTLAKKTPVPLSPEGLAALLADCVRRASSTECFAAARDPSW